MRIGWAMLSIAAVGCASVRVVQRDQCWVRQTRRLWQVKEELGPCQRPPPTWSQDRLTRVMQECVAQADYRWQNQAVAAWARGEPLPARPSGDTALSECMEQTSKSMLGENERLHARISELAGDKDAAATQAQREREHLLSSWDTIAADLGEAAKRPLPPATATATATGEGRSASEGHSAAEGSSATERVASPPANGQGPPLPSRASDDPPLRVPSRPGARQAAKIIQRTARAPPTCSPTAVRPCGDPVDAAHAEPGDRAKNETTPASVPGARTLQVPDSR